MTPALSAKPSAMNSQPVRLPVAKLTGAELAAGVVVCTLASAVAGLVSGSAWMMAAGLSSAAVVGGTLAGLILLALVRPRPAFTMATAVVGASAIRLTVSLAVAAALFFSRRPEVGPFWAAFLLGSFAVLAAEATIVRSALLAPAGRAETPEP